MFIPNQEHLRKNLRRERPKQVFKSTKLRLQRIADDGGKCSTCITTDVRALIVRLTPKSYYVVCRNCDWIERQYLRKHPQIE